MIQNPSELKWFDGKMLTLNLLNVQTVLVALTVGLLVYFIRRRFIYRLPPGPWAIPLIGNFEGIVLIYVKKKLLFDTWKSSETYCRSNFFLTWEARFDYVSEWMQLTTALYEANACTLYVYTLQQQLTIKTNFFIQIKNAPLYSNISVSFL